MACATFSPDGRRLVTASGEAILNIGALKNCPGKARVWDVSSGQPLTPPMPYKLGVLFAIFSPDGQAVATASLDKTARVWDSMTGAPLMVPLRHRGEVYRLAFAPDGRRLATACLDEVGRIWDITTSHRAVTELKESWLAGEFAFSSNGERVVGKSSWWFSSRMERSIRITYNTAPAQRRAIYGESQSELKV